MAQGFQLRFIKLKAEGNAVIVLPATSFIKFFEYYNTLSAEMAAVSPEDKMQEGITDEFIKGFASAVVFMNNSFTEQLNKATVDIQIAEITPGSTERIKPESI
jgi:hypothetical protein